MPKLYSSKKIAKVLESDGFFFVGQHGSHGKFRKNGDPTLTVILPMNKKEIPQGTFRSILKQSHLEESAFL